MASIDTRDAGRDAHLRSPDFFETDTYPTMTYRSMPSAPTATTSSSRASSRCTG